MNHCDPFKIIGIHNQHPSYLFVQFSLGERYFMYELNRVYKTEQIREQYYIPTYIEANIDPKDEEYLMGKLQFYPKTKRIISEYRYHA